MEEYDIFAAHTVLSEISSEVILGRGTRAPDLQRLFAVLAARQRALPTVQAMRAGTALGSAQGPPDRMVSLFAPHEPGGPGAGISGPFNRGTAHYLTGPQDGEEAVYRGA
jgi:hypothetical protein